VEMPRLRTGGVLGVGRGSRLEAVDELSLVVILPY